MVKYANEYGEYHLTEVAGSPSVCISHGMVIYNKWRGKGKARGELAKRMQQALNSGYTLMVATVAGDNAPQIHILSTTKGWRMVSRFKSCYGDQVTFWICELQGLDFACLEK